MTVTKNLVIFSLTLMLACFMFNNSNLVPGKLKLQNKNIILLQLFFKLDIMVKDNNCIINKNHICFMFYVVCVYEEIGIIEKCLDFCTESYTLDMCFSDCAKKGFRTAECVVSAPNTSRCCCFTQRDIVIIFLIAK